MVHKARSRRRAALEARIREEALALVIEGGLDDLTMARLARRLDLSVGALYRYHPSKDALIAALQAEILGEWEAAVASLEDRCAAMLSSADQDAALLPLVASVALYAELPAAQPGPFALMSRILGDPQPVVEDRVAAAVVVPPLVSLLGRISAMIQAATGPALDPGDPGRRALSLFAAVHGVLQLRKLARLAPQALEVDGLALDLAAQLLQAWGAAPQAIARCRALLPSLSPLLEPS